MFLCIIKNGGGWDIFLFVICILSRRKYFSNRYHEKGEVRKYLGPFFREKKNQPISSNHFERNNTYFGTKTNTFYYCLFFDKTNFLLSSTSLNKIITFLGKHYESY